jgi:hypothetical protein
MVHICCRVLVSVYASEYSYQTNDIMTYLAYTTFILCVEIEGGVGPLKES